MGFTCDLFADSTKTSIVTDAGKDDVWWTVQPALRVTCRQGVRHDDVQPTGRGRAQFSTYSPAWPTMSLFLTIFVLTFVTQLISWVGQSVLLERVCSNPPVDESPSTNTYSHPHSQAYEWYLWLTRSDLAMRHRELKKDLLTKKAELLRLSAKDHFAKYMKLKRSVDKGLSDLEKLSACCSLPCFFT